jgi:hypothetical protein
MLYCNWLTLIILLLISIILAYLVAPIIKTKSTITILTTAAIIYAILLVITNYVIKINVFATPSPSPNSAAATIVSALASTTTTPQTGYYPYKDDANSGFAREKDLEETKYGIFKHKSASGEDKDAPPFDGLDPNELMSRLQYIYQATANPYKSLSYTDYKMHADKFLDEDGTKLSTNDAKLLGFSRGFYPQLTADQIDARDCLNYGSGPKSCFQSAQLFANVKTGFKGILDKGVNEDNANLIIREDFTNPEKMNPETRYKDAMFVNAPLTNLDIALDTTSNELIQLNDPAISTCRNCKLAVCMGDYCGFQNQLFM